MPDDAGEIIGPVSSTYVSQRLRLHYVDWGNEHKPPLLLADEPTGNLDPDLSRDIMRLFEHFNQVGVTVLIASHDLDLISRLPYPQLQLHQGKLLNGEVLT